MCVSSAPPDRRWLLLWGLLAFVIPLTASSHARHLSRSRWNFRPASGAIGATITFDSKDLEEALAILATPLPKDGDARAAELERRIYAGIAEQVQVTSDGAACKAVPLRIVRRKGFEVGVRWECSGPLGAVQIRYRWMTRMAHQHRHLARVAWSGARPDIVEVTVDSPEFGHVFERSASAPGDGAADTGQPTGDVAQAEGTPDPWAAFGIFFREGLAHIATGYDHILFLLALLAIGGSLWRLGGIVTAFTLAHSVTLGLAYAGVVDLPGRWVEVAIAASIVFVAVENLWMRPDRVRWPVAFLFGLIHGFGFAGFLTELDLGQTGLLVTLAGFNLGVEAGQMVVVLMSWPLIAWASAKPWYRSRVLVPVSVVVGALGALWMVERLLG